MPKRCVAYVRVSTAEQAAVGHHSLEAQEILCRRHAESHGLEVLEVLRDEGYSGLNSARPGLRRLMEYTSAHPPVRIDAILVQDTSRMGRDTTEYLLFRRQLRERGIELIAVTQPNIDSSAEGRLMDTIVAGINQYQSEEKGRRVAIALQKKFEEGWWPSLAPLGYRHATQEGKRCVVTDPDRFHLLTEAFREYATGSYAQEQLCAYVTAKGLRDRRGKPVSRTTMNELLSNRFYFGLMRWNGQERMGKHEPATDKATWDKCQEVTAQHNQFAPRSRKHKFLLAGLVRCANCGSHLTHSVVARKNKRYYHCPSRPGCDQPFIREEALDAQAQAIVEGLRFTDKFIDRVLVMIEAGFVERHADHARERDLLNRKRLQLEERRQVAEKKLLDGILSDEAFQRQVPPITAELETIRQTLEDLEINRSLDSDALREVLLFARDLPKAIAKAPKGLRRRYLSYVFKELIVQDKKIIRTQMTDLFKPLLGKGLVRTQGELLPSPALIQTLLSLIERPGWLQRQRFAAKILLVAA